MSKFLLNKWLITHPKEVAPDVYVVQASWESSHVARLAISRV